MTETPPNAAPARIPLEDADLATLKHFAGVMLGLEIERTCNRAGVIAKIKTALPTCTDIPPIPAAPPMTPAPATTPATASDLPVERPSTLERAPSQGLLHPSRDPKVLIEIAQTSDTRRQRDVPVHVNGDVWMIQRGVQVEVPYRVYLALLNGIEKQAVETTEKNPVTGDYLKEWRSVHSYPFMVHRMPSAEEIAAWHAETDAGFKSVA